MKVSSPKLNNLIFANLPWVVLKVKLSPTGSLPRRFCESRAIVNCFLCVTAQFCRNSTSRHCED